LKSANNDLKKLLKQLSLIRIVLYLSFLVAMGTTASAFASPLLRNLGFGQIISGPAVQTTAENATATTTTMYSSTVTAATALSSTGYTNGVAAPTTVNRINYFGFTALISWVVFGAALIWRGHVRSVWGQSRFSYDTFRLLVKMRGGQTRLKLMRSLNPPKNKLQLATALEIDWKAVDRHVQVLQKNGLIQAASTSGTSTFYEITEKGRSLLQVLEQLNVETPPETD
jgi:predicted transcriptional regulator